MPEECTQPNVLVLLSGGIDSAACVAFHLEEGFTVRGLYVDYGQPAVQREKAAAGAIANHYRIPLSRIHLSGACEKKAGVIRGRNAFLLTAALMECPDNPKVVGIGIHSGTDYADCSPPFILAMQSVFDTYTQGRIQIGAPFLTWTKADIWTYCKSREVPLELTYSCERGLAQPCGKCISCRDLEALRACA